MFDRPELDERKAPQKVPASQSRPGIEPVSSHRCLAQTRHLPHMPGRDRSPNPVRLHGPASPPASSPAPPAASTGGVDRRHPARHCHARGRDPARPRRHIGLRRGNGPHPAQFAHGAAALGAHQAWLSAHRWLRRSHDAPGQRIASPGARQSDAGSGGSELTFTPPLPNGTAIKAVPGAAVFIKNTPQGKNSRE